MIACLTARILVLLAMGWSACASLRAAPRQDQEVVLAIPGAAGTLSLGVFSEKGLLIRTLAEAEPVTAFRAGLNGLHISWDSKDNNGVACAPGRYFLRGWFVPDDVVVEGEDYHFNDWLPAEGPPEIESVIALVPGPDASSFIVGRSAGGGGLTVWEVGDDGVPSPGVPVHAKGEFLGADSGKLILRPGAGGGITLVSMPASGPSGGDTHILPDESIPAASVANNRLAALLDGKNVLRELLLVPEGSETDTATSPGQRLVALRDAAVFLSDGIHVWMSVSGTMTEIPLGDTPQIWSLSAGPSSTFWIAGRGEDQVAVVRQYDPKGELLRQLVLDVDVVRCRVDSDGEKLRIFLVEDLSEGQRVRILQPLAPVPSDRGGEAPWEVILDKTIRKMGKITFIDGKATAAPDAAPAAQKTSIALAPNELEARPSPLVLSPLIREGKLWMGSAEGLPLIEVASATVETPFAIAPAAAPGTVKVLLGLGASAAEFSISGLQTLSRLDGGEIFVAE